MKVGNLKVGIINIVWLKFFIAAVLSAALVISVSELYQNKGFKGDSSLHAITAHLNIRIPELMGRYDIPGAGIALIKKGRVVWSEAYGYADIESGRRMTVDTYLRVQSISKPVTAWGVLKLAEQKKISLDAPVIEYLDDWEFTESEFNENNITVRHLLSHRAGLPLGDIFNIYSPEEEMPSLKECLAKEAYLIQEPGASFMYSNTGYNLLELLIEEVTDRDFAEYMEREVLIPLGMNNSSFNYSEDFDPPVPYGYDLKGKAVPVYVYPEKGSGGLFATVEDIGTFVCAGMPDFTQNTVISDESIEMLYTPLADSLGIYGLAFDSYGLGYYMESLSGGITAAAHGGQGTGWMTHFHSVPETGDGIVIMTNSQRSWPLFAYVLSDWAKWNGFDPPGMSRIITGVYVLWLLVGLIWFIVFIQLWNLTEGFITGKRKFSPFSRVSGGLRLAQSASAVIIMAGLLWCANQEYLFISSAFPVVSVRLGFSIFAFSVLLFCSAFFRRNAANKF